MGNSRFFVMVRRARGRLTQGGVIPASNIEDIVASSLGLARARS
jgi:hypothetical protein